MNLSELSAILYIRTTINQKFYKKVNILNEKDLLNNPCSAETDGFVIDDIVSVYPDSNNFGDLDCPPCTFTPCDCCYSDVSPTTITQDACEIWKKETVKANLTCQGRILTIKVVLKRVCPNKKIAIGVLLYKGPHIKGFKAKEIVTPPLPPYSKCKKCIDVVTCEFCFVIPGSICHPLTLRPKIIAHYTDINRPIYKPECKPEN